MFFGASGKVDLSLTTSPSYFVEHDGYLFTHKQNLLYDPFFPAVETEVDQLLITDFYVLRQEW